MASHDGDDASPLASAKRQRTAADAIAAADDEDGFVGDLVAREGEEPWRSRAAMLRAAGLDGVDVPGDGNCGVWAAMLASAFAWLPRGFFREHPWPINVATEADRLAVKEMFALRGRACDWLGAPAQWRMLRTMGPYVREFPAFAAEQLRSASSALRARLHAEARTRLCAQRRTAQCRWPFAPGMQRTLRSTLTRCWRYSGWRHAPHSSNRVWTVYQLLYPCVIPQTAM